MGLSLSTESRELFMSDRRPLHWEYAHSRRDFLARAGGGFGLLAFWSLFGRDARAASQNPIAPRLPHFPGQAPRVIWCFMDGRPSHIGLLAPKPAPPRLDGTALPQ